MLASYYGALKTWLYAPVLHYSVSYASIRVPALLIGSLSVFFFFPVVERLHSRRAAWLAALLLSTDAVYLLTTCFDWGPVALQHLFLVLGLLLAVLFVETASRLALAGSLLVFGLALWDKALFIWIFSGIIVATIVLFPKEVWTRLTPRNTKIALLAFCLGSLPLIIYNATHRLATYRANTNFVWNEFHGKFNVLRSSWKGPALFGYLVHSDDSVHARLPETALERWSFRTHSSFGDHPKNQTEPALLAALLLVPILWFTRARRLLLFSLLAAAIAWFEMAITRGAGAAAHHSVLLWPLPHLFLAVALAEASRFARRAGPWLIATLAVYLVIQNLLVVNQYFYGMARNGTAGSWTDAIYPLSEAVAKIPADRIVVNDWGILNPLELMHRGALPLMWAEDPYFPVNATEADRTYKAAILADRETLWISHTEGNEQFPGVNARLTATLASAGYQKQPVTTIADRNGRPTFQLFRVVPSAPARP